MIAYRAETAMTMVLREVMCRQDDTRSLIRDLFLSEADILPDTDNKILNVCIHHTAEARHKSLMAKDLLNIPGATRTHNLWLRRPTLYPIELRGL